MAKFYFTNSVLGTQSPVLELNTYSAVDLALIVNRFLSKYNLGRKPDEYVCPKQAMINFIAYVGDDQGFDGVSDQIKDITFTDSVYRANTFDVHVQQTYKKTVRFQYKKDGVITDREVGIVDDSGQYIEGFDFTKNEYRKFFKNQIVLGSYFVKADVK